MMNIQLVLQVLMRVVQPTIEHWEQAMLIVLLEWFLPLHELAVAVLVVVNFELLETEVTVLLAVIGVEMVDELAQFPVELGVAALISFASCPPGS